MLGWTSCRQSYHQIIMESEFFTGGWIKRPFFDKRVFWTKPERADSQRDAPIVSYVSFHVLNVSEVSLEMVHIIKQVNVSQSSVLSQGGVIKQLSHNYKESIQTIFYFWQRQHFFVQYEMCMSWKCSRRQQQDRLPPQKLSPTQLKASADPMLAT